ncbi:MAG: hypothetical protein A2283_06305 [Lentisphaerae bacterium RIFOXYA12_FULL_48_11]|nr:MAG: hypothetical protein A2283_06305 [Lentisphaerae bacterium RIFOXYA12_FULL_48_11]
MRESYPDRTPAPGETCCVGFDDTLKRASMLFDRVYVPAGDSLLLSGEIPADMTFGMQDVDYGMWRVAQEIDNELYPPQWRASRDHRARMEYQAFRIARKAYASRGLDVVPVYTTDQQFALSFAQGQDIAFQGALRNLPEIVEAQTTWKQIIDYRSDPDAVRKFRALRFWLQHGVQAKSVQEATDIIGMRLDAYGWALRKHGFKTVTGALTSILDWQSLATAAGGAGVAGIVAGPVWAALVAGALTTTRVAVWAAERRIELEDVRRGENSEVAIIFDARRQFGVADGQQPPAN